MIPLSIFRNTTFSAAAGALFLMTASTFGAVFLTSQFFQFALGNSPLGTGIRLLPWTAMPCLSLVAGALSDRIGCRALMVPGLAMLAAGYSWIAVIAGSGASNGGYVLPFLFAGVGIAMVVPTGSAAALKRSAARAARQSVGHLQRVAALGGCIRDRHRHGGVRR